MEPEGEEMTILENPSRIVEIPEGEESKTKSMV
jgi:hypothetical protein